jgi:hypothetical protein
MLLRHVSYKGVPFYVPEEEVEEGVTAADVGMQHWFNDSLRSTLTYAEQVWHVNQFVRGDLLNILEVFCGFGMSTAPILQSRIDQHVAFDIDPGCVTAFKHLREDAKVVEGDSYYMTPLAVELQQYDYVLLEHNALTVYGAMQDPVERALLNCIFNSKARYVAFVDSAKVKEHLHYRTYSKYFQRDIIDSATYVRAIDRFFRSVYGYHIKAVAHDSINYTYLLEASTDAPDTYDLHDTRGTVNLNYFKEIGYLDVEI